MRMALSESSNKTGIYELFQDLTGVNSTSYPLAKFVRDANNALAQFQFLANKATGKWQVDDTNQTDYPILKVNIVSGQQDYPLTIDASSVGGQFTSSPNQIWDIARVEIYTDATGNTIQVLEPYDQTDEKFSLQYASTITGVPYRYDKLANGLFLDPKPNYSRTAGMFVYYQRSPLYFVITATTGTAGIPDIFDEYLAYRPAFLYCVAKGLAQASGYLAFLQKMEKDILEFYVTRNKDEHSRLKGKKIQYI